MNALYVTRIRLNSNTNLEYNPDNPNYSIIPIRLPFINLRFSRKQILYKALHIKEPHLHNIHTKVRVSVRREIPHNRASTKEHTNT